MSGDFENAIVADTKGRDRAADLRQRRHVVHDAAQFSRRRIRGDVTAAANDEKIGAGVYPLDRLAVEMPPIEFDELRGIAELPLQYLADRLTDRDVAAVGVFGRAPGVIVERMTAQHAPREAIPRALESGTGACQPRPHQRSELSCRRNRNVKINQRSTRTGNTHGPQI